MAIPPFLVEKAAGIEIADALPAVVSRKLDGRPMAAFCSLYRRIAISRLLATASPNDFLAWLAMSAQAFLHWLEGVPEEAKLGSLSDPSSTPSPAMPPTSRRASPAARPRRGERARNTRTTSSTTGS
jgi:hypothetical protein